MQIKDIAVCVFDAEGDMNALTLAQAIAGAGAHVSCSAIGILQTSVLYNEFGMAAAYVEQLDREKELVGEFQKTVREKLARDFPETELRCHQVYSSGLEPLVAQIGRHADLTVIRSPGVPGSPVHDQAVEAALLGSGRPVLVVPAQRTTGTVGQNILVGWDASREAARAVHDALLLAGPQARITVVTVDARPGSRDHGEAPGLDIATHLARHGLQVDVRNEAGLGQPVHEILVRAARDTGADLMVMGGYRHSRLQQTLFGGVTRSLIGQAEIPLMMSH